MRQAMAIVAASVLLAVGAPAAEPNVSVDSFTASPSTISVGGSSTLSWSTTNATSCSIDQGIGAVAADGSVSVAPTVTTTYTLTAEGPGGPVTQQVTVTVGPADLEDPTVAIMSPSDGGSVYDTLSVNGSASDDVAVDKVEVSVSGGAYVRATGNADWSVWTYSFDAHRPVRPGRGRS